MGLFDLFDGLVSSASGSFVNKALNTETDYARTRRERHEESRVRDKAVLKRDMAVEAARRIRKEEREEAETARRAAEYERNSAARAAAREAQKTARVNREFFEEQMMTKYFERRAWEEKYGK
ncbi:MAG: hypothetical protein LQ346_001024 [Caloplaca aetnensis]|nr:MAG: hypothetical protein LQ346_001024 [Caloplaca aetnensis]